MPARREFHYITDVETIGNTFLIVCHSLESGRTRHFWESNRDEFIKLYKHPKITFVGFNSARFDAPLIQAFVDGADGARLKTIANKIIEEDLLPWQIHSRFDIEPITADWIDIKEPTPGVMLSLKTYEGRMHYPHIRDLPIDHNTDISGSPRLKQMVLDYCINDVLATAELFRIVRPEITLREQMSAAYGIDLRSKSGAQAAEAILKLTCSIPRNDAPPPVSVGYTPPPFVKTDNPSIQALIDRIAGHSFDINNGSPKFPDFLTDPVRLNGGIYQFGIGGLHSQHDTCLHVQSNDNLLISDFDVASYYPSLLIAANLVPRLPDGKGDVFMDTYKKIFSERIDAKRKKDKDKANSLKLVLNSTFGKLGNQFCSFYSPDLMLAVTISGQLNLLILIDNLEKIPGVTTISANTDGICVTYPPEAKPAILDAISANTALTGFEYEETPYREIAFRDVNSYVAVTTDGKAKRKGAFAGSGVMEMGNPTFQICAEAATNYILHRTPVEDTIRGCEDIRQFVTVRNVTGGGVQHKYTVPVDDWALVKDMGSALNEWYSKAADKTERRKSRPRPIDIPSGGKPFGRVARWYRSTRNYQPLTYVTSGNRVPDSEQARLCLDLPLSMPDDIDIDWYINRANDMLKGAGV